MLFYIKMDKKLHFHCELKGKFVIFITLPFVKMQADWLNILKLSTIKKQFQFNTQHIATLFQVQLNW